MQFFDQFLKLPSVWMLFLIYITGFIYISFKMVSNDIDQLKGTLDHLDARLCWGANKLDKVDDKLDTIESSLDDVESKINEHF
jgi:hypothetical protein